MFRRTIILAALAAILAPIGASAESGDDQFAVAAGHYKRGRWKLAGEEFADFLEKFPQHSKAADGRFFFTETLVQQGQVAESQRRFREFLSQSPEHRFARQAFFRVGEASFLLGDFAAARQDLEAFRAKHPDDKLNAFALPYLGEIALAGNDHAAAKVLFEQGLERYPDGRMQDDCRYGLARAWEKLGDAEQAMKLYLGLSGKTGNPLADDAQFRLGALEYDQGQHAAAVKTFTDFEGTFADSPLLPKARLGRGWALFQSGEYETAQALFVALQAVPELGPEASYWLGLTLAAQKQWAAAAETLDKIKVDPQHELAPLIVYHSAYALVRAGDSAGAAARFDRLLAEWPTAELTDGAVAARTQLALDANDHETVDKLVARQTEQRPQSPFRDQLRRKQARSLTARKKFAEAALVMEPLVANSQEATAALDNYLLAAAYLGQQRFADALPKLQTAVAAAPDDWRGEANLALGTCLIGLKQFTEALPPLEACLQQQPDGPLTSKCLAQLAVCHALANQLDQAETTYRALLARKPDSQLLLPTTRNLAETAFDAKRYDWSTELFTALSAEGVSADQAAVGLSGLAWTQFRQDKLADAAETFGRLLTKYPDDPLAAEAALVRGQSLEKLDQTEAAVAAYQLVVDKYAAKGDLPKTLRNLGRLNAQLKKWEAAEAAYRRLATEFTDAPQRDAGLYEWAWVLRQQDKAEDSDGVFQQIRSQHPTSVHWADSVYRLAERAHQLRQEDRAEQLLQELLAANPPAGVEVFALYLQGQVAYSRQQYASMAEPLKKLVEKHPQSPLVPRAEYWLGEAAWKQGNFAEAAKIMAGLAPRLAGQQDDWVPMVALRQAQSQMQLKKYAEAQQLAQQLQRDVPNFEQGHEVDYVLGRCLAGQAEFDQAREAYRRVTESESGHGTETAAMAQWMIGESFVQQKNYSKALREFLRLEVLYDFPTWQAAALFEAGKCHEQLGEWKQASELYDRIIKEFPEAPVLDDSRERLRNARERIKSKK